MNVDLLQTAKDLVKKGIELNDMELVKMGNNLLDQLNSAVPAVETPTETLQKPPEGVILQEVQQPESTVAPEQKRSEYDFSFQISDRSKKGREAREDGKMPTRSEPIDLNRVHSLNMFEDDRRTDVNPGEKGLYIKPPVERRKKPSLIRIKCDGPCQEFYVVNPIHCRRDGSERRYVCDKCTKRKGRPERL